MTRLGWTLAAGLAALFALATRCAYTAGAASALGGVESLGASVRADLAQLAAAQVDSRDELIKVSAYLHARCVYEAQVMTQPRLPPKGVWVALDKEKQQ